MDQDTSQGNIDIVLANSKPNAAFELSVGSGYENALFESHLRLVQRWIQQLLSQEALDSIDAEQLASDIVEELIRRFAKHANADEILREETIRLCRQITKSQCINAVNHIHCQKRASHREDIDLASLVNPRDRNGTSESESAVEYDDFVQVVVTALPPQQQRVVELVTMDFTKTEIADKLGVSVKILKRMLNEIGVVVIQLLKDTNSAPSPITHHPSKRKADR